MDNKPNKLINEKSPYLQQHAYNPVEWFPWGEEAFEKAKAEDKPIFLSVGYSTCHWCHVMEHESFEDNEVAEMLNETFVAIKVDREERPDIDNVYMTVCQMMTGGGGWPLTVFLTPDKKPFFAGTYFPKEDRHGRAGIKSLATQIKSIWNENRDKIDESADKITEHLLNYSGEVSSEDMAPELLDAAYDDFYKRFDKEKGGFGRAPKFPSPHNLLFLLRYWKTSGDQRALEMVIKTLVEMRKGGIYDHVGYGFHRYSTDNKWLLPHFEKMLYDQAMITQAYIEAYQATGDNMFASTAKEIISYVERDMTSPEGGFYSAEDADSEGIEGKFYVWTEKEIMAILEPDEVKFAKKVFNIEEDGNFEDEASRVKNGLNILYLKEPFEKLSTELGLTQKDFNLKAETILQKLFDNREGRVRPLRDEKILTDWNGMMIKTIAKAGMVFGSEDYIKLAKRAADFILSKLYVGNSLLHRYKDGEAVINAHLDDYSFLVAGLIELYEATGETEYLSKAILLNNKMIEKFYDNKNGGFYFTESGDDLIVRKKELFDAAIPSGNSVAVSNMLKLAKITADTDLEEKSELTIKSCVEYITKSPTAFTHLLSAYSYQQAKTVEIIISGNDKEKIDSFYSLLSKEYLPYTIIIRVAGNNDAILNIADYTAEYVSEETKFYVCENYTCSLPVTSPQEAIEIIKRG